MSFTNTETHLDLDMIARHVRLKQHHATIQSKITASKLVFGCYVTDHYAVTSCSHS